MKNLKIEDYKYLTEGELDLRYIAEELNLQYIETTSQRNGYPSNIKGALIGFDNFEQAEFLSELFDLKIQSFERKDGWQLWYRTGNVHYEEIEQGSESYGDNYHEYCSNYFEDEAHFLNEEVLHLIEKIDNFEEIQELLNEKKIIWKEIENLEDNQSVINYCGEYFDTINTKTMYFAHDTKHLAIGLIS